MSNTKTRDDWQRYEKFIKDLAHRTIRSWMVGVEVEDIKQELWAEFFRICGETPEIVDWAIKERLEWFASSYKTGEREAKYGQSAAKAHFSETIVVGRYAKYWKQLRALWDTFLGQLPTQDAMILRYMAQGCTSATIAKALAVSDDTILRRKKDLITAFRKEVENNVQIDKPDRDSRFDEGL